MSAFKCNKCDKSFAARDSLKQHKRDKHGDNNMRSLPKDVRRDIAADVFGDLPDGAFFAASEDTFGLSPEDWID